MALRDVCGYFIFIYLFHSLFISFIIYFVPYADRAMCKASVRRRDRFLHMHIRNIKSEGTGVFYIQCYTSRLIGRSSLLVCTQYNYIIKQLIISVLDQVIRKWHSNVSRKSHVHLLISGLNLHCVQDRYHQ